MPPLGLGTAGDWFSMAASTGLVENLFFPSGSSQLGSVLNKLFIKTAYRLTFPLVVLCGLDPLQVGNANFSSSKFALQELFMPFHPLEFLVEILLLP